MMLRAGLFAASLSILALTPASSAATPAASREAVPFIRDDYRRALAEARRRHVPIFIDAWAPW